MGDWRCLYRLDGAVGGGRMGAITLWGGGRVVEIIWTLLIGWVAKVV